MIVVAGDLHLTPLTWLDQPNIHGDSYRAWLQIVQFCCRMKVTALFLLGDIFDKPRPDSESVSAFEAGMDMLAQHDVLVYFIQGQHDRSDPPWASALSPIAKYIGDGTVAAVTIDGITTTVRGYDNMSATHLNQAIEAHKDEPTDIVLIHQLEKSFVPFEGGWDFDMEWVPDGVQLVLGGDYHQPVEAGRLWYTGSTYSCDITQFSERSFLTVKGTAEGLVVERQPLRKRPVLELSVVTDKHLEAAVDQITNWGCKDEVTPLVFAKYSSNVENVLPTLEVICERTGYILRTKALGGGTEVVEGLPIPEGDTTLEACLAEVVDRSSDEEFYSFALALLKAENPKEVLEATKARLGIGNKEG